MEVIGRKREIDELQQLYQSGKPEFVALYGRRRVGKTYLVKELFSGKFTFWHTGMSPYDRDGKYLLRDQLQAFLYSLQDYGYSGTDIPKTWLEAFRLLELLLNEKDNGERMLIFIDELPWMDTLRSRFIPAFEHSHEDIGPHFTADRCGYRITRQYHNTEETASKDGSRLITGGKDHEGN